MLSLSRGTPTGSWPEIQLAGPQNQGILPSGRPPDDQRWQTAAAAVAGSSLVLPAEMPSCERSQLARPSWSRGAGYLGAGWSQARVGRGVFVVAERGSAAVGVSVKLVGAAVGATVVREASMVHAAVVHFQAGQEVGHTLKMAAATTAGVDARALHFLAVRVGRAENSPEMSHSLQAWNFGLVLGSTGLEGLEDLKFKDIREQQL